jgi:hypothetical protein
VQWSLLIHTFLVKFYGTLLRLWQADIHAVFCSLQFEQKNHLPCDREGWDMGHEQQQDAILNRDCIPFQHLVRNANMPGSLATSKV